jgi:hypothetical protein
MTAKRERERYLGGIVLCRCLYSSMLLTLGHKSNLAKPRRYRKHTDCASFGTSLDFINPRVNDPAHTITRLYASYLSQSDRRRNIRDFTLVVFHELRLRGLILLHFRMLIVHKRRKVMLVLMLNMMFLPRRGRKQVEELANTG